ncbi:hypothetical protein [Adlercreutzia caecimuris]|uniref:hypothetical protein n=1 Tax=Adlercreutzia caecimuris TaxID=671266 RepID=UPI00258CC62C|nr:hypothetical protein [Adlercreutzia caecimuris]
MEFAYDPELIRELAVRIVCPEEPNPGPWTRYEIAGIEAYSQLYARSFMEEIAIGWDEARGDSPAWEYLDDLQRHKVLVFVAHFHQTADSDYFDGAWSMRIAWVFEDDIADDPEFVIG